MVCTRALVCLGLAFTAAVQATEVMRRPDNYKSAPNVFPTENVTPHVIHKRATAKVQAAYFTNWGIYGANFQPTDIVPEDLTHIIYAFADVQPDTGTIVLTDSYADEQKHFDGDSWDDTGNNLYGCLKQLYLIKLANRNIKTLLSIGGWTYSQDGHFSFVTDATKRATFVSSAVSMIQNLGFDGIDIDFEYPANAAEGQGFADLLTSLRSAFDTLATQNGDTVPYQLTAAVAAGPANYQYYVVPQMDKALTYWNLMAYDYSGSFSNITAPQDNVYGGALTGFSTDAAIQWYFANGATPSKINLGMPLYGHAFENTAGMGSPYDGIGPGSIQAGIYSYKDLPIAGAQVFENVTEISSYSYDSSKKELVSYDTPDIVKLKTQYVMDKGLAGSMFWDLSTDKVGTDSLVGTSHQAYSALDQTQNHINYPDSEWDNIRNNMAGSTTSTTAATTTAPATTTVAPTTTTAQTTTPATSTTSSTGGSLTCAGVAAWNSAVAYTGGQSVTYGGFLWTAKWWTEGDTPGGAAGVWTQGVSC
ncbi:hypothetical protein PUNSTDRAFT_122390 [Punctularia strigosozonata HHB-11173 SS5]|uniref:uncharacterized protein n=1 Tax=Punctularia strigosozonata (strain HHB-11173) TaxID=741275 RepID=UPI0004417780|nr:uncharacterized protein PUNSTDRAFT_122390 [Punctularia strigosozonata HHB-11173 SS5]EIN05503.1 hypothetical protein PUNSTDRAFT_122390 [Punctularia strigosozonata HHB-11173 SS5]